MSKMPKEFLVALMWALAIGLVFAFAVGIASEARR